MKTVLFLIAGKLNFSAIPTRLNPLEIQKSQNLTGGDKISASPGWVYDCCDAFYRRTVS
jgi:hypothetical protein